MSEDQLRELEELEGEISSKLLVPALRHLYETTTLMAEEDDMDHTGLPKERIQTTEMPLQEEQTQIPTELHTGM